MIHVRYLCLNVWIVLQGSDKEDGEDLPCSEEDLALLPPPDDDANGLGVSKLQVCDH